MQDYLRNVGRINTCLLFVCIDLVPRSKSVEMFLLLLLDLTQTLRVPLWTTVFGKRNITSQQCRAIVKSTQTLFSAKSL